MINQVDSKFPEMKQNHKNWQKMSEEEIRNAKQVYTKKQCYNLDCKHQSTSVQQTIKEKSAV